MVNESNRVYLIGAGASASLPYRFPTLKTLLWHVCQEVGGADRTILDKAIYEACGVELRRPEDSPDFEEFLNRLDARSLLYLHDNELEKLPTLRRRAAAIALRGLRDFIRKSCLSTASQEGPYDRLVRSLKAGQVLVSFNWDVLLEVAFRRSSKRYTYLGTRSSNDATQLLRPHGCISWFALLDRELLSIDTTANVRVFGGDLSYYMLYLEDPLASLDMGNSNWFAQHAVSPLASIVPPSAAMLLSVGGPASDGFVEHGHTGAMRAVWSEFRASVAAAREIVVIGYSLPGTDASAIEVLKEFAAKGNSHRSRKSLFLVDPDREVVERYRRIVFPQAEVLCDDFSNFDPGNL